MYRKLAALASLALLAAAQNPPPFSVDLAPVAISGMPALQSFSIGISGGRWLLAGGRTNGLHAFVESSGNGSTPPPNAFPPQQANNKLWVVDAAAKKVWSAPVTSLAPPIAAQLSATNAEYVQDGNTLYIFGGYGMGLNNQMTTFGAIAAIQVKETIDAVVNNKPFTSFVQQTMQYTDCPLAGQNTYNSCFQTQGGQCQQGPGWAACQKKAQAACLVQQRSAQQACVTSVRSGKRTGLPVTQGAFLKVTGGGAHKIGNTFYLVFGQDFEGLYSVREGDYGKWPLLQNYAERFSGFQLTPNPLTADLLTANLQDPADLSKQFHRRDLNVTQQVNPRTAAPRLAALGGVFVPGGAGAYRQPLTIENAQDPMNASASVASYQQVMNQYNCAAIPLFDRKAKRSITLLTGGISLYYVDWKLKTLKMDEGLPFNDSMNAIIQDSTGAWSEFVRMIPLGSRMGAGAEFIPLPGIASSSNGVIYSDAITRRAQIGFVFGGILAPVPNPGAEGKPSTSSSALYAVFLTPATTPPSTWMPAKTSPQK
ncbi:MAG: hypothetical protein JST93_02855 [Acidobacteria bacterium]|nr:hypothetical protein [Acidobacteriota bacterium]